MSEIQQPVAQYADVFDVTLSPYGASFRFGVRGAVDPKTKQQSFELVTRINMSLQHLKAMSFVICKELLRHEKNMNTIVALPDATISQLCYPVPATMNDQQAAQYMEEVTPLALEQWRSFWQQKQVETTKDNMDGQRKENIPAKAD